MTATVGLRSGLTRHWTGSLLDLDCSSEAALDDCFEKSATDTFYANWCCAATTSLEQFRQDEYTRLIRDARNSGACIYETPNKGHANGFSKSDFPRDNESLTANQFFRLRQLFFTLHRNFNRNYHKNPLEFWRESAWCSNSAANNLDDSQLSYPCDQSSMWSVENSLNLTRKNKWANTLFRANFQRFFANEANLFWITKARRRHCNSEGDLTFLNPEKCSVVQKERLSQSVSDIPVPTNPIKDEDSGNDLDQKLDHANSNSDCTSSCSVETLTELTFGEQTVTEDENEVAENVHANFHQTAVTTVSTQTFCESLDLENIEERENNEEKETEETDQYDCEDTPTLPNGESSPIIVLEDCDTVEIYSSFTVDASETTGEEICADTSSCLSRVPQSNSSVTNLERENSTASSLSSRLVKTVSFADEVGQSLTEVFLFNKVEDECRIPDYDDEFDGPFLSFVRKPQAVTFERFTRSRVKRGADKFLEIPCTYQQTQTQPSSSFSENRLSSEHKEMERSVWVLGFSQPAAQYYEFRQRVENGFVSLENITLTQPEDSPKNKHNSNNNNQPPNPQSQFPHLSGTIKVKNLAFDKNVWLRMTTDQWKTYTDFPAIYNAELSSGSARSPARFDTFTFQIPAASFPQAASSTTDRIEFAIRYWAGHDGACGQFWDNNDGQNYVIERRRMEYNWSCSLSPSASPVESFSCLPFNPPEFTQPTSATPASVCNPYTPDYRPNFSGITSFTDFRAWEHFATDTIYY